MSRRLNCRTNAHTTSVITHKLIERTPPPGGGSYLLCSLIKNREEEDPPEEPPPKMINFEGGSSSRSLIRNIVNRNPPQEGGFLSIKVWVHSDCGCQNVSFMNASYVWENVFRVCVRVGAFWLWVSECVIHECVIYMRKCVPCVCACGCILTVGVRMCLSWMRPMFRATQTPHKRTHDLSHHTKDAFSPSLYIHILSP